MSPYIQPLEPLEEALFQAGAFHPEDLVYNEAGALSPAQKRWLMLEISGWLAFTLSEVGLASALWWFYFQYHIPTVLMLAAVWGSVLAFLAATSAREAIHILDEIKQNEVDAVAGAVLKYCTKWTSLRHGVGYHYSIKIRGHAFDISPDLYVAISDQVSYRLFYIPGHWTLVNIEPLSLPDTKKQSALLALQQRHAGRA